MKRPGLQADHPPPPTARVGPLRHMHSQHAKGQLQILGLRLGKGVTPPFLLYSFLSSTKCLNVCGSHPFLA
jgi:hypothetical protein